MTEQNWEITVGTWTTTEAYILDAVESYLH